jgi:mxaL protein
MKAKRHRDLSLLAISFIFLCGAIYQPSIPVKHNIYSYFFILDITQSMNTQDMKIAGNPASRLEFSKQILRETISTLPCGTKASIGLFTGVHVVALYQPIDVCTNFSSIQDTIDHVDWRSAWTADSRVRESLLATAQVVSNFPEPVQVVYFSDGEEAPKLHAFNTRDLSTFQSGTGWLLVGIGSDAGGPIPRLDKSNQLTGYWSHESMQLAPGAAPIAAAGILQRKSDVAESPQDRYVSKLAEDYLKNTAKELSATYIRGKDFHSIYNALKSQKPTRREWAPYSIAWILASFAGLLIIAAHVPWDRLIKRRRNQIETSALNAYQQIRVADINNQAVTE